MPKFTSYELLSATDPADIIIVQDVSDISSSAEGTTKYTTIGTLLDGVATGSTQREALSDYSAPYSYIGVAAKDTTTSTAAWKITRINATTGATAIASPVKWDDRLTADYI